MTAYFIQAIIYLSAAVITVPISKRLGLGSVLGYLIAGVIIGPLTGLVGPETEGLQHFAEFGIVMMLFLVGLELDPKMFWRLRNRLLGLGSLQLGLTAAAIMLVCRGVGLTWSTALAVGLILSLSSTAIVLQTLHEKGLAKTEGGVDAFSVLLFQDIAVIPILAFMPFLAQPELANNTSLVVEDNTQIVTFIEGLHGWHHVVVILLAITTVVVGGHYLSRPVFNYVANSGLREIFTATTLLILIGIAALMSVVGLSPALGTFLAGVILANSEFRHELESNIQPFKGLLLGLFFITVGAGINFSVLSQQPLLVISLVVTLLLVKFTILYVLTVWFKIKGSNAWLFSLSLAQAGEFGFVLLTYSLQNHVLSKELAQILLLVVAFSMLMTPILFIFYEKIILPCYREVKNTEVHDVIDEPSSVIIAGMGRFGQIINRLLTAHDIHTVALDHEVDQIESMRQVGIKSYFGDATDPALLDTAGIKQAQVLVVAIDDKQKALEVVAYVKHAYPKVRVFARAFDRGHHYNLRLAGADKVISESYHSALELGGEILVDQGMTPKKAEQQKQTFQRIEKKYKETLYQTWKDSTEDNRFNSNYQDIFMQVESILGEAMKAACEKKSDSH